MGQLNTFPLSLKVSGLRIVIVGGGQEALNKARLASKTTASVVIVSPHFDADFSGLPVHLARREFEPADLDGAALVFVAQEEEDRSGRLAVAEARARRVPLNVVDVPDACDFYTPSIIERAPLTIAVSSEGQAPVLARLLRARIEAMLSPRIGEVGALAGRLRHHAERLIGDNAARRRFYEALVTSPEIEAAGSEGAGDAAGMRLLEQHAKAETGAGVVWLIGAGPGAEDLLTLRAQRLLQEADVIVHDQLVPARVIEMGRRDAERISVGKAKGLHSFNQAQINTLIVRLAEQGKRVARLKSGDPMVFGRAGEEIEALRKAGIGYQIVPGVSAALAAAADTASPVTLRKVSSGFVMATAHGADNQDLAHWAALAASGMTLALYMGKSVAPDVSARLIEHGAPGHLPVGVVVNAGRPERVLYRTTLGGLAGGATKFAEGPAVILVGEAVAHGDWYGAGEAAIATFRVA